MVKKCLFCENDFDAKRESAKYCSDNCRVKWNYKFGKKEDKNVVTELQVQVLYNAMLEMVSKNKGTFISKEQIENKISETITSDLPWDKPKPKIRRSFENYQQLKLDCETIEDWQELKTEILASELSQKQKQLLTT